MKQANIFYVYILFRPWNGIPFYVGKGKGDRIKRHFVKNKDKTYKANIIKKAKKLNLEIPVVKIRENLTNNEALELEIIFIKAIGRKKNGGPLVNLTNGGDGTSGWKHSKEAKERMRKAHIGKKWALGYKHTEEDCRKLGIRKLGNKNTLGHKQSLKTRNKIRIKLKGNKNSLGDIRTLESRAKMSAAQLGNKKRLGIKHTAEAKAKISATKRRNTMLALQCPPETVQ